MRSIFSIFRRSKSTSIDEKKSAVEAKYRQDFIDLIKYIDAKDLDPSEELSMLFQLMMRVLVPSHLEPKEFDDLIDQLKPTFREMREIYEKLKNQRK